MHSTASGKTLRFGIMSDGAGKIFAEWQARCIRALAATPNVTPALLIHNTTPVLNSISARIARARPNLLLGQVYRNILSRPRSAKPSDVSDILKDVPEMSCAAEKRGKFSEYVCERDVRHVREHNLDFILRFGFGILRGDILNAARYGVWSFHHGDEEKYRGVSEGFWEIMNGEHVVGAILQRLTNTLDAGVILRKGHFAIVNHSWTKTRDRLNFEGARWPAQVCTDILNGVGDYVDGKPSASNAPLKLRPTNVQTIRFASRVLANKIKHAYRGAFVQTTWGLGVVEAPIASMLAPAKPRTRHLADSSNDYRYLADPFALKTGAGTITALCEQHDLWSTNRGAIVNVEIEADRVTSVTPALNFDGHASYPSVFRDGDYVYCAPETCGRNRVELFRAGELNNQWTPVRVILENFPAVDPTIFQHDGKWWLTATSAIDGPDHNLYMWYANALLDKWEPHPANPVKCDVRSARPAGTPFVVDGILYRPAQDCSDGYGRRITINAIEQLTPSEFRERVVAVVEPDSNGPFPHGIHTLSAGDGLTLVDGRRDFFDLFKQVKKRVIAPFIRRFGHRGS